MHRRPNRNHSLKFFVFYTMATKRNQKKVDKLLDGLMEITFASTTQKFRPG